MMVSVGAMICSGLWHIGQGCGEGVGGVGAMVRAGGEREGQDARGVGQAGPLPPASHHPGPQTWPHHKRPPELLRVHYGQPICQSGALQPPENNRHV